MVYRLPPAGPASQIPPERRGAVMGRFCLICAAVYPLHRAVHAGQPVYGRDHIASPCAHEGDTFTPGASWWEPAVEVLPAPPAPPKDATPPAPLVGAPGPAGPTAPAGAAPAPKLGAPPPAAGGGAAKG